MARSTAPVRAPASVWTVAITLAVRPPDGPDGDVRLLVGDLASVVVDFMIVGWVLFLVVRGLTQLRKHNPKEPANKTCDSCLEKVAYHAKRCKFCTSELQPGTPSEPSPAS